MKLLLGFFLSIAALNATGQFGTYLTNHTRHTNAGSLVLGATNYSVSPADKLEVFGNIRATFTTVGTGNLLFGGGLLHLNNATNNFSLRLNTTERLFINNSSGFIGIGTNTPLDLLHVNGNSRVNQLTSTNGIINGPTSLFLQTAGATKMTILGSGNIGIGLPNPGFALDVNGTVNATAFRMGGANVVSSQWVNNGTNINFTANGVVSIGTTSAPFGSKLAVAGKITAEEVVVKLQGNWPDYVFEEGYKLLTLEEIESYIKANKHLPGVPSVDEVKENGISVGEMNGILLKKIEELTLHIIELEKKINGQDNK